MAESLVQQWRRAIVQHRISACAAYDTLKAFYAWPIGAVPGMDTCSRLAIRIDCGKTVEQAAASEYLYRWHLALRSPVFGVPHTLGV